MPSIMASWTKENLLTFVKLYRSCECLWKPTSKDYCNRYQRDKAYEKLANYCREFEPTATKDTVTKKISNLRACFKKEYKKFISSKETATCDDDVYRPRLWYFNEMLFVEEHELQFDDIDGIAVDTDTISDANPSPSSSSYNYKQEIIQPEEEAVEVEIEDDRVDSPVNSAPLSPGAMSEVSINFDQETDNQSLEWVRTHSPICSTSNAKDPTHGPSRLLPPPPPPPKRPRKTPKFRKRKWNNANFHDNINIEDSDDLMKVARENLLQELSEEELVSYGKNIAHRLRNVEKAQRIHALKFISDILYEAELGTLSRFSTFGTRPAQQSSNSQDFVSNNCIGCHSCNKVTSCTARSDSQ